MVLYLSPTDTKERLEEWRESSRIREPSTKEAHCSFNDASSSSASTTKQESSDSIEKQGLKPKASIILLLIVGYS